MSAKIKATPKHRPDIDGLRGLAVLSVVVFHAFPGAVPGGFVGVDIFFVLSGFLISRILWQDIDAGKLSYWSFYERRIRRIFPALVVVLLAVLLVGYWRFLPDDYRALGKHAFGGSAFVANFLLLRESGYFASSVQFKPLLHLWSLSIEEQFYLFWPLLLAWLARYRAAVPRVLAVLLLTSFAFNLWLLEGQAEAAFYLPTARVWELLIGSLLAWLQLYSAAELSRRGREAAASIGLLLVVLAFWLVDDSKPFPGAWALLPTLGTFLLIAAGGETLLARGLFARGFMVGLGKISYPLYLWHWPLLAWARIEALGEPANEVKLGAVMLSVLLAWTTYELVEKKIRPHRGATTAKAQVLLALMAMLAVAGIGIYAGGGLPSRFPANVSALASFTTNFERDELPNTCFLDPDQDVDAFDASCMFPTSSKEGRKRLLLWGDSHAAHLYPGLAALANNEGNFDIAQFTVGGCPPLPGLDVADRPYCRGINQWVVGEIESQKPDVVLLAADWRRYRDDEPFQRKALPELVKRLLQAKVQVVVFGAVPLWQVAQPKVILEVTRKLELPLRRSRRFFAEEKARESDAIPREALADFPGVFISPLDFLCDAEGCLLFADFEKKIPIAWDTAHLTAEGSRVLIDRVSAQSNALKP